MKVLMFCPTYMDGSEAWIRAETRAAIGKMAKRDLELEVMISTDNPYPVGMENVMHQYQMAREMTLAGDYRALLTVEHDMLPPDDGFEKLDAVDAPVVYGLYLFRHGSPVVNALRNVASENVGMSLSHFPDELREEWEKKIAQVSGAGFGFTLMRREVLERIPFRRPIGGGNPIPDLPFAEDCLRQGMRQMCRFDVRCGHFHKGNWLWPGEHAMLGEKVNVLVMQDFVGLVGNQSKAFRKGKKALMSMKEAGEYERAGYVQVLRPVAVKLMQVPEEFEEKVVAKKPKPKTTRRRRSTK